MIDDQVFNGLEQALGFRADVDQTHVPELEQIGCSFFRRLELLDRFWMTFEQLLQLTHDDRVRGHTLNELGNVRRPVVAKLAEKLMQRLVELGSFSGAHGEFDQAGAPDACFTLYRLGFSQSVRRSLCRGCARCP